MKPEPREFTKERPCSKPDIFVCFWGRRSFLARQVFDAEAEIGRHVPRHMIQEGRLELTTRGDQDIYRLTVEGKWWLWNGTVRYLSNHPERLEEYRDRLPKRLLNELRRKAQ